MMNRHAASGVHPFRGGAGGAVDAARSTCNAKGGAGRQVRRLIPPSWPRPRSGHVTRRGWFKSPVEGVSQTGGVGGPAIRSLAVE
jgi:hypothetical protein